jgi:hypothetical protein
VYYPNPEIEMRDSAPSSHPRASRKTIIEPYYTMSVLSCTHEPSISRIFGNAIAHLGSKNSISGFAKNKLFCNSYE